MNIHSLRMTMLICGVVMLIIAMWANINLYASLASSPVDKVTWATLGFVFDVTKITLLIISGALWTIFKKPFGALLAFLFWLVLTGLSLSTLFGYTSKVTQESERQAAINSMGFKSAQNALESTEKRLADMASVAAIDVNALQTKFDALSQRKASAESELAACPRDYVTKCIKPARAKIESVQRELAPIEAELNKVKEFRGLQASKASAMESSRAALSNGASEDVLHPMFTNGAVVLNELAGWHCTGRELKVWFLALSAFLCELLASFLLLVVASIGGRNLHAVQGISVQQHQGLEQGGQGIGAPVPAEALASPK